uniref:Uncharacterized protein n=1 Tax=Megaselia scalaris TaxID=36166 RepID=T1GQU7_MEGSC
MVADFNDPDVGPGVPYVFKDEDENQASDPKGIVESSSNKDEVVVSTTTPTPILSSTTATPAQTFSVPTKGNKGHLASNSVFPSTATAITTHFQKASQHQQQNFQSQFISSSQNQNRVQVNRNSLSSTASSTFSSSPSPFKQSSFGSTSFQASTSPSFNQIPNSSTKFTGRFGGAPGILGEQVTPGFGVRPSAFSKPTTTPATLAPAASNVVERRVTSGSGRYTGGFGGPPGILVPFDNVKKSA